MALSDLHRPDLERFLWGQRGGAEVMRRALRREDGVAYLLVLAFTGLLGTISAVSALWVRHELAAVEQYQTVLDMRFAARDAVLDALRRLADDPTPAVDGAGDPWAEHLGRWGPWKAADRSPSIEVRVRIEDAGSRVNLNFAPREVLLRLPGASPREVDELLRQLAEVGVLAAGMALPEPPESWQGLVDRLGAANANVAPLDALKALLVQAGVAPFHASSIVDEIEERRSDGRGFESLEELVEALPDLDRTFPGELSTYVDVEGQVNVNTAREEVLAAFVQGIGEGGDLAPVIAGRSRRPFESVAEAMALAGEGENPALAGWLTVRSSFFRVIAEARAAERGGRSAAYPEVQITVELHRRWDSEARRWLLEVLTWQERP